MNKAVMISIKPKWCELIASGKKTIEVRKTRTNLEPPFKCYIYKTKETHGKLKDVINDLYDYGKVIGEFVCDKVYEIKAYEKLYGTHYGWNFDFALSDTCLSENEFENYLSKKSEHYLKPLNGCGLHISDLKIYDKPKELGEFFYGRKYTTLQSFIANNSDRVTRPPQSWCYVEELEGKDEHRGIVAEAYRFKAKAEYQKARLR